MMSAINRLTTYVHAHNYCVKYHTPSVSIMGRLNFGVSVEKSLSEVLLVEIKTKLTGM